MANAFHRLCHFRWHIFFVVLGQHFGCRYGCGINQGALRYYPLPLTEQVGENAGIGDRQLAQRVRHGEGDRRALAAHDGNAMREILQLHLRNKRDVVLEQLRQNATPEPASRGTDA